MTVLPFPNSRRVMTLGSDAPAGPVHHSAAHPGSSVPRRPPVPHPTTPAGVSLVDCITFALGMVVFGGLAWFFLVIA